jgi:hypothetical protein
MNDMIITIGYVLCILFTIYIFYFLFSILSSTKNISDTKLGKSIIDNTYETIIPTSFKFGRYDVEKYNLTTWEDKPSLINPTQWSFDIKLLDSIPLDMIDNYIEADIIEDSKYPYPKYLNRNILESENPNLRDIFDTKHGLKTKKLKLGLYSFQFFNYEIKDIIDKNEIKINEDVIRKVE